MLEDRLRRRLVFKLFDLIGISGSKSSKTKSIEDLYQKKSQREHILLRPETYVGSMQSLPQSTWVYSDNELSYSTVDFVPALYKIFDEILVNAADNVHRSDTMSEVRVNIKHSARTPLSISIYNDGKTIPVVMHSTEKVYVPELIFGHLLTSSNYDDSEQRFVGGRHGYGAKLTNIFSKSFVVELYDEERKLHYRQEFKDNMSVIGKPEVTVSEDASAKSFTKITFVPGILI